MNVHLSTVSSLDLSIIFLTLNFIICEFVSRCAYGSYCLKNLRKEEAEVRVINKKNILTILQPNNITPRHKKKNIDTPENMCQ